MLRRIVFIFSLISCILCGITTPTLAGDLHGTITWQYNNFIGTRGDSGSKIWLWPVNYDKNSISKDDEASWIMGYSAPNNCFVTKTDGYGKFEIYGIPAGEYVIFISSKNTKRDFRVPVDNMYIQYFSKYFNDMERFKLFNLNLNKFEFTTIKIVDSRPNVYNYDFGNTFI